jgi:type VI protein secretion system component VasK
MKSLLEHQEAQSRRQQLIGFAFYTGLVVAACAMLYVLIHRQRYDDRVALNAAMIEYTTKTVEQVRAEVDRLERSNREIRETTEPLRGLSKAIGAVKDATEPVKGGRP